MLNEKSNFCGQIFCKSDYAELVCGCAVEIGVLGFSVPGKQCVLEMLHIFQLVTRQISEMLNNFAGCSL
jgi:hypothetical protein